MRVSPGVCNLGMLNLNIQTMNFTKAQISESMCKHTGKEKGLYDLMKSMMVTEGSEFLRESPDNKGNSHRPDYA